jgi:acetyltransferase
VLGAWLGTLDHPQVRAALEAGGVPDFYTPENAVEAFSFLAAYRRNQALLLEVPAPQPEPRPLELAAVERIRDEAASANRTLLTDRRRIGCLRPSACRCRGRCGFDT